MRTPGSGLGGVYMSLLALGLALDGNTAEHLNAGRDAFHGGRFNQAFGLLTPDARAGDAQAMYLLGTLYRLGKGVARDEYTAFVWHKRAAEAGVLEAQYQLGMMYLQGEGVTANDEEALKWLWRAAEQEYPEAAKTIDYLLNNDFGYGC